MDRADGLGTGVAVVGHVALFGALSFGLAASIPPKPVPPPSMEVAFVEEVALTSSVPTPMDEAMPAAEAPEIGPVDEAMPQPAPVPEPLPAAPPPQPAPAPPKIEPVRQPVAKPLPKAVAPTKPVSAKRVAPKPAAKTPIAKAKSAPAKPAPKTAAKSTETTGGKGEKTAARAPRLGKNFLAGLSDPSPGKAEKASAPTISADAMAGIQAAIKRQIQPCANRQVNPGPGASRISVKLNLKLNKDGSLAGAPRVVSTSGVDDENSRYEKRVADLAVAAYTGCAPMRGLPVDLYRTATGGWSNFNMNYKLPG